MRVPPEEFEAYLAPGESVVEGVPGTIVDGSYRSAGAIGLTDRRVLFVADGDRFLDVAHSSVASIRSGPRTTVTAAAVGYPLLVAVGGVLAVAGLLGAAAFHLSPLGIGLAAASVAGVAVAEYVRRIGLDVDVDTGAVVESLRSGDVEGILDALGEAELCRRGADHADNDALVLGVGLVALFALVGLVALAGTLLVVPPVVASLLGIGAVAYGYRRNRRLGANGGGRRRERDVRIHLVDGRVVDLRVDAADRIDHALSDVVRAPGPSQDVTESGPSTAGASGARR